LGRQPQSLSAAGRRPTLQSPRQRATRALALCGDRMVSQVLCVPLAGCTSGIGITSGRRHHAVVDT